MSKWTMLPESGCIKIVKHACYPSVSELIEEHLVPVDARDYQYVWRDNRLYVGIVMSDTFSPSPRLRERLGVIVTFSDRFHLSDLEQEYEFDSPQSFLSWAEQKQAVYLPIYLYTRSGLSIRTGSDPNVSNRRGWLWIGWIYTVPDRAHRFGMQFDPEELERALKREIDELSRYLNGDIYAVVLTEYELRGDELVLVDTRCVACGLNKHEAFRLMRLAVRSYRSEQPQEPCDEEA